nr:hypothetical protein [Pandoravirus aubagnensis]
MCDGNFDAAGEKNERRANNRKEWLSLVCEAHSRSKNAWSLGLCARRGERRKKMRSEGALRCRCVLFHCASREAAATARHSGDHSSHLLARDEKKKRRREKSARLWCASFSCSFNIRQIPFFLWRRSRRAHMRVAAYFGFFFA